MAESDIVVAHHFEDAEQQLESNRLGMWAFLVTEVMMFGGLFLCYIVYRRLYPEAFAAGSGALDVRMGAINTVVLIVSSLTMALAVHAAQEGRGKTTIRCLALTLLMALVFLAIKYVEYAEKFAHHWVPGDRFVWSGPGGDAIQLFFGFYFVMTGLHAVHMLIGMVIIAILIRMTRRGRIGAHHFLPVEITGLYWHFVDVVWIFLFPLFYLIGRHT